MSDCQTCEREGVCDYAHKPCDCVYYRKFVAAPKRPSSTVRRMPGRSLVWRTRPPWGSCALESAAA